MHSPCRMPSWLSEGAEVTTRSRSTLSKEKGTTQGELASRANLTRTSISNIEAERQRVTLYALLRMAEALDVAPATLCPT